MIRGIRDDVRVIELVGEAARRFANGQFTNNVRDLGLGAHQFTAMTDDRGRLVGLADLLLLEEGRILMVLEGMSVDAFEEFYRIPLMLEDLEVVRLDVPVHTLQGGIPAVEGRAWLAPRSVEGGIDLVGELPESLASQARVAEPGELEALRIEAGWPRWPIDASDKQLPHELGLRDTHLHFEKGCYKGQEIIHRIDVMGGVRKGLVGLRLSARASAGADLFAGPKKVGRLGSSAVHPVHGLIALAVVRNEQATPGTKLTLEGATAEVAALPFT